MNRGPKPKDMTGKIFTRLRVLSGPVIMKNRYIGWKCQCICGRVGVYPGCALRAKRTKSCGCLRDDKSQKRVGLKNPAFRHGMSNSPEYLAYQKAKTRCTNPNTPRFENWGGRGIKFLFSSFTDFLAVIGPHPGKGYSLDRYPNNDGHYEPGNVRWATREQQMNNRRIRRIEQFSDADILREFKKRRLVCV